MAGLGERYPDVRSTVRTAPGRARAGHRTGGEPRRSPGRRHPPTGRTRTTGGRLGLDRDPRARDVPGGRRPGAVVMSRHEDRRAGPRAPAASCSRRARSAGSPSARRPDRRSCPSPTSSTARRWSSGPRRTASSDGTRGTAGSRSRSTRSTSRRDRAGAWWRPGRASWSRIADELALLRAFRDPQPVGARVTAALRAAPVAHPHRPPGPGGSLTVRAAAAAAARPARTTSGTPAGRGPGAWKTRWSKPAST